VKLKTFYKYFFRFFFLQVLLSYLTIWYFDNFLVKNADEKFNLFLNLLDDRNRFFTFIPFKLVTVDTAIVLFIFLFLVFLYSTKFYTYVNELDYSMNGSLLDEFINVYLIWTSFFLSFFFIFRFEGLSRLYILLYTLIPPVILLILRNSEILSLFLGRSIINENYISFDLDDESKFRTLRIMSLRKSLGSFSVKNKKSELEIVSKIDELNKSEKINLIIISLNKGIVINKLLQEYLINLNKKVLIISKENVEFEVNFLNRVEVIDKNYFVYFNNDIQYGSKFILKRIIDISLTLCLIPLIVVPFVIIAIFILLTNGRPIFVVQNRIGLHGVNFRMLKFRTMTENAHNLRDDLSALSNKSGPLFKIDNDPRLLKGAKFLRKFSLDELPQLLNVLKGDMSLVGPRPLFDTDTKMFNKQYMRRLNVLPGMTGLLQINARNADDFETWFKYDVEYIDNWNLLLDFKILFLTLPALFKKEISGK